MNPVELLLRRRQVRELVRRDSVDVVLRRQEKIRTPAGGYTKGPVVSLTPQRVAIWPFRRRVSTFLVNSVAGDIPELACSLVGAPDLDVRRGDLFTHEGQEYEIIQIEPDRSIRTSCQANYYGKPS